MAATQKHFMKKQISVLSVLAIATMISLVSCMKENKADNFDTQAAAQSDDQSQVSAQIDGTSNEVSAALEATGTLAQRGWDLQTLVCNAVLTADSANATRTLTLTYNGADCLGRFNRTGVVKASIPAGKKWKDAGTTITVQYTNVVFKNLSNNKSITINGSHTITNVNGGLLYQLGTLGTITHDIKSDGMTVTFDNGSQRTWKVARRRVFTFDNGYVITVTGTHTEGNVTNVAEWGTNRDGRAFTSAIAEPLVFRQDCDFRLGSGKITHTLPAFTSSATFGLNSSGVATACPGAGKYYAKIEWAVAGGTTHTSLHPY
jgi:hypothetical protein